MILPIKKNPGFCPDLVYCRCTCIVQIKGCLGLFIGMCIERVVRVSPYSNVTQWARENFAVVSLSEWKVVNDMCLAH